MALKLSDADKKTIVELYRHPEESTATLASRYAVSSSTISRILKQELSPDEYQDIVQQKKGGGSKPQNVKAPPQTLDPGSEPPREEDLKNTAQSVSQPPKPSTRAKPSKRVRTRQRPSTKTKATLASQDVEPSAWSSR